MTALSFPSNQTEEQRLHDRLLLAEALERTGNHAAAQAQINRLQDITNSDQQRSLLNDTWRDSNWSAFRKYFYPNPAWRGNVGDVLLQRPEVISRLEVSDLLDMTSRVGSFPQMVQDALDNKMRSDPREPTIQLRRRKAWLRWRLSSYLNQTDLRASALAWLYGDPETPITLEEWKQVLKDIGVLRKEDFDGLPRVFNKPRWPLIPLFEGEQFRDLSRACDDVGMLAYLAESINEVNPPYQEIMQYSKFSARPLTIATLLGARTYLDNVMWQDYDWDDINFLCEHAGHRAPIARKALAHKVVAGIVSDWLGAREACIRYGLQSDPYFTYLTAHALCNSLRRSSGEILDWLNNYLITGKEPPSNDHLALREAARDYDSRGYQNLGRFLWPELQIAIPSQALDVPVQNADRQLPSLVRALCSRNSDFAYWQGFMESANNYRPSSGTHPFRQLAEAVRNSSEAEQDEIDQNGCCTFRKICDKFSTESRKTSFLERSDILLELFGVLSKECIGKIAANVAVLAAMLRIDGLFAPPEARTNWYDDQNWWRRLVEASKSCPRRRGFPDVDDRHESVAAILLRVLEAYPSKLGPQRNMELKEVIYSQWEDWKISIGHQYMIREEVNVE